MKNLKSIIDKLSYSIEYDASDNIYIGRCAELPDLCAHAISGELALKEIKVVVLETLIWMQENKETIPEPFSV